MSGNASVDEKDEVDNPKTCPSVSLYHFTSDQLWTEGALQDKCQKHICCNLRPTQRVNQRITNLTPIIPLEVAGHEAFEFDKNGLPVPEPAIADREDNSRYSKAPNEEIYSNAPSRVDGAAMALEQSEEQEERVIQEGEEDLKIQGSCKRSNGIMTSVMDVLVISSTFQETHATRILCDRGVGSNIAATCNLQEQGVDHQSSHYHHNVVWTMPSLPRKGSWR